MSTPLLIGNGLAMLISAYEIGRRGQAVRLLTDGKPLGGTSRVLRSTDKSSI